MPEFIYVPCPNCKVKIKIDKEKKYHDCPDCKFEFRLDDLPEFKGDTKPAEKKESIFGKFIRENKL